MATNTASIRSVTNYSLYDVVKSAAKLRSPMYRFAATSQVTTSTTETTILTYVVPPVYDATDLLKFAISLRTKNNSGSAATFTIRVKVDGTTVASVAPSLADSASSNYGVLNFEMFSNRASALCTGVYHIGTGTDTTISATSGFTLSANSVVTVTVQMGTSNAATQFELLGGYAKVID